MKRYGRVLGVRLGHRSEWEGWKGAHMQLGQAWHQQLLNGGHCSNVHHLRANTTLVLNTSASHSQRRYIQGMILQLAIKVLIIMRDFPPGNSFIINGIRVLHIWATDRLLDGWKGGNMPWGRCRWSSAPCLHGHWDAPRSCRRAHRPGSQLPGWQSPGNRQNRVRYLSITLSAC